MWFWICVSEHGSWRCTCYCIPDGQGRGTQLPSSECTCQSWSVSPENNEEIITARVYYNSIETNIMQSILLRVTEMFSPGGCTSGSFRTSSGWRRSSGGSYETGCRDNFPGLPAVIDQHFFTFLATFAIGQKIHVSCRRMKFCILPATS